MGTVADELKTGCGGTDAAALFGENPWRNRTDTFLEKTGRAQPREETPAMRFGLRQEPILRDWFLEARPGLRAEKPATVVRDPEYPFLIGHPDYLTFDGQSTSPDAVIECKTAGWRQRESWGEPGSNEIPRHYLVQVTWYMGLLGLRVAHVPMFLDQEYREYVVLFDAEFFALLREVAVRFWLDYVQKDRWPEAEDLPALRSQIQARWPRSTADMVETTPPLDELVARYAAVRQRLKAEERLTEEIEVAIKSVLGDHRGVISTAGKVLWGSHEQKTTDRKAVLAALDAFLDSRGERMVKATALRKHLAELTAESTTTAVRRPFRFYPLAGDDEAHDDRDND